MYIIAAANRKKRKPVLNYIWTAILLIAFTVIITVAGYVIQPDGFWVILSNNIRYPVIFILNALPVLIVILFFFFILNNVFYAAAFSSIVFNMASMINRYKIMVRDDPFVPLDIFLGAEATKILYDTGLGINMLMVAVIALFFAALLILGIIIKFKKIKVGIRLAGCALLIAAALMANSFIYGSRPLYDSMPASSKAYVTGVFNEIGLNYCFLYNLNAYKMEVPDKYSKQYVQQLIKEYSAPGKISPAVKPHVVMIMNEAFSDLSLYKAFNFTEEDDPLKNYKNISSQKNALPGHIIVPNFGGGTANTEFDVLTGLQTINLNDVPTSAFRLVRKNTGSVARVFMDNSYRNLFMHPGDDWFYNRSNVYRFMGMDDQIFADEFKKPQDFKGSLVSDKAAGAKIIQQFEKNLNDNKGPLFNFTVTIQNHMPYTGNKYASYNIKQVPTAVKLSKESQTLFSNYFEGVRDADALLKTLTDYFNNRSEPVVLVFFGDHKPSLGAGYQAYREAGIDIDENGTIEQAMNSHMVPLLIWTNQSAFEKVNFEAAVKKLDLPEDKTISANYLGPMLLELLGYRGQDPYYDFLNEARRKLPVITRYYFKTEDGKYTGKLSKDQAVIVNAMKVWQYYRMDSQKFN